MDAVGNLLRLLRICDADVHALVLYGVRLPSVLAAQVTGIVLVIDWQHMQ